MITVLFAAVALSQQRDAAILGTVTDPDGRAVASAPIQAKNIETETMYQASTSASGNYTLTRLPGGTYAIVVPSIGFTLDRFEAKSIVVAPAQTLRVDIQLKWGSNLGTPGDDQSTFNIGKYGTQRGPAPRTREGKPDFSGVWIGNNDPNTEEPAMLAWAETSTKAHSERRKRSPLGILPAEFRFPRRPVGI